MSLVPQKALAIKSAIPHPRIMGVIRECGGKMHMHERSWADAATDFFEAFKSYDEARRGGARRAGQGALQRLHELWTFATIPSPMPPCCVPLYAILSLSALLSLPHLPTRSPVQRPPPRRPGPAGACSASSTWCWPTC